MYQSYKGIIAFAPVVVAGLSSVGYGIYSKASKTKKRTCTDNLKAEHIVTDIIRDSANEVSGQADAVIVDAVNAIRINRMLKALERIDKNQAGADEEIRLLKAEVQKLLTSNRGGTKGIHGFIGETSQVHISNIKAFLNGDEPLYILLDDNSMTDYTRGIEIIQQKACQADGHLGLDAIKRHKGKYPEFVEEGGIYQIPKDMFGRYNRLKNLPEDVAMKLRKEDLRLWKYIRAFTEENPDVTIEPMEVTYSDIQAGNIEDTVKRVEDETGTEFEKQKKAVQQENAPTFEEFLKICSISAAIEGGVSAGTEFIEKLKSGKKLSDFTKQDYKDIFSKFAIGSGKGALRGSIVYIATNVYKIPAAVISGIVTAVFGVAREVYLLFKKKITKEQFRKNSFFVVLETVASTGGASLGRHLCKKRPIIGALVGSILGSASAGYVRRTVFA